GDAEQRHSEPVVQRGEGLLVAEREPLDQEAVGRILHRSLLTHQERDRARICLTIFGRERFRRVERGTGRAGRRRAPGRGGVQSARRSERTLALILPRISLTFSAFFAAAASRRSFASLPR